MCGYYYHLMLLMLLQTAQADGAACRDCKLHSQVCYPGIGCVAVSAPEEVDCYGVCINAKETPSLSCVTVPCPHNPFDDCGEVRDSDQCYASPVLSSDGSCAKQGEPLVGCNKESLTIMATESEEERVRLTGFLFAVGVLLLFVMLMIGVVVSRQ